MKTILSIVILLLLGSGANAEADAPPPEIVTLAPILQQPSRDPIALKGALRRPEGRGPFAAVVLLHSCDGNFRRVDDRWGKTIASWRYVTLAIDSFGPRNIEDSCTGTIPTDMYYDPYQALRFLA